MIIKSEVVYITTQLVYQALALTESNHGDICSIAKVF